MGKRYHFGDDFGSLGVDGSGRAHYVGPLIGGGATQIGILGAKMLGKNSPTISKYAPLIGGLVGALAGGGLMFSPKYRASGLSALITALLIAVPQQLEQIMGVGMHGYLGVITPEEQLGQPAVQLLDSGTGSLGVITPEEQLGADGPVEMMGDGFGSNFLSAA
jgi:hypothetical protein